MNRARRFSYASMALVAILFMVLAASNMMRGETSGAEPQHKLAIKHPNKIGDTYTNALGMKFAYIPAGEFDMGSPRTEANHRDNETLHHVKITGPFMMGVHHVTRAQFAAFLADSGYKTDAEKEGWTYAWTGKGMGQVKGASWRNPGFDQGDNHPVVDVSWNDAIARRPRKRQHATCATPRAR